MINDNAGDFCEKCLMKSKFNGIERIINILSNILLIFGIVASVIMSFTIIMVEKTGGFGRLTYTEEEFSPIGLAIVIATLLSSVILWALLRLAIEVSVNIREIAKSK